MSDESTSSKAAEASAKAGSVPVFPRAATMSGYPFDADEQEAIDRVLDRTEKKPGKLRSLLRRMHATA